LFLVNIGIRVELFFVLFSMFYFHHLSMDWSVV
jgi:hypothetical protein